MKIIYDDIIYSLQCSGGVSLYWSQLEKHLRYDMQLLYNDYVENIFWQESEASQKIKKNVYMPFERYKNIHLVEKKPFVFHSSYYRYCTNKNSVNITTVHDFVYEKFRHDIKSIVHKIQKKNAVYNSQGVIFVSENTKNDFESIYPDYKGKKRVIHHGLGVEYKNMTLPKKNTVVFIGGRTKYKNFVYALKLMQKMEQFEFQIIGGGFLNKKEIGYLNEYIPNRYEYYHSPTNEELNLIYNEAFFLLYPSLYEGFGFPVLEAQAAGCPVVCCHVSSLPEVAGDAAIYITGCNIDDDLEKILQLNNRKTYNKIIKKGLENCRKFTWEKCAENTYKFYEEVYDLHKR